LWRKRFFKFCQRSKQVTCHHRSRVCNFVTTERKVWWNDIEVEKLSFWHLFLKVEYIKFWKRIPKCLQLPLKMETVCFSKMLVPTHKSTWCYSPEDQHWDLHYRLKLKSYSKITTVKASEEKFTAIINSHCYGVLMK
jgi:hypothetical protein